MNALYTKIAILAAVLAFLCAGAWYLGHVKKQRDEAIRDAQAYRQVAIVNYRYIGLYEREKAANEQWEREANADVDKIVQTGCEVMPKSFRDWLKRVQPSERTTAR